MNRLGIDAAPEGHYAESKRSDIRVSHGGFNVPGAIKKSSHHYLEAHGTGTEVGGLIEIDATAAFYGRGRDAGRPIHCFPTLPGWPASAGATSAIGRDSVPGRGLAA